MRNTGKLKRDESLKSGGSLGGGGQLIPLKSLGSRKRLRARSDKTSEWYAEERAPFVADYLSRHPRCQFVLWLHPTTLEESPGFELRYLRHTTSCGRTADDIHEIQPRGRGGAGVPVDGDLSNFIGLCRLHHIWVTSNPKDARRLGYTR